MTKCSLKANEHIFMHMSCAELCRLMRGLWVPYRHWIEHRLPKTAKFLEAAGSPENLADPAPLSSLGAAEVLAELQADDLVLLGADEKDQIEFVIEVTKGGIEAEAAWRAKQDLPRTSLETLPEEGAARSWEIWGGMTPLGPKVESIQQDDEFHREAAKKNGLRPMRSLTGSVDDAFRALAEVDEELRRAPSDP